MFDMTFDKQQLFL